MKSESSNSKRESAATSSESSTRHQRVEYKSGEEAKLANGHSMKTWLTIYKWLKRSLSDRPVKPNGERLSWSEEFSTHRITFVTAFAALVLASVLHVILPFRIEQPPLAIFGCSLLTLIVNARWGTIAAILYCIMVIATKIHFHVEPFGTGALLWNFTMRFLFLEIFVVLFAMLRSQASSSAEK